MPEIPLSSLSYVVIDFETTGLNAGDGDEIIEIGAIKVANMQIKEETFSTLVNPERKVSQASSAVHGITDNDLKDAPTISEVMPDFLKFIGHAVVVAQNAKFDLSFLVKNLARHMVPSFENPIVDTMLISRFLFSYESRHNLDAIMSRLKIEPDLANRHRSLADCEMTAKALVIMIEMLEKRGFCDLRAIKNCTLKAGPIPLPACETMSLF